MLLNYENHLDLATNRIFFDKLIAFCVSQGWTLSREERSKQWAYSGGSYQFIAGNEEFAELKSKDMIVRLRLLANGTADNEYMDLGLHRYDTLNTANAGHPVTRNGTETRVNGLTSGMSFQWPTKMINIPSVWFFGNDYIIYWMMRYSSTQVFYGFFGRYNQFDNTKNQHWIISPNSGTSVAYIWSSTSLVDPTARTYCYFNNTEYDYTSNYRLDFRLGLDWSFNSYVNALARNAISIIRPLIAQKVYTLEGSQWRMDGTHWIYRCRFEGLEIGQRLKYDGKEYLVFPDRVTTNTTPGLAFRVV